MSRYFHYIFLCVLLPMYIQAGELTGVVMDDKTGELLVGATIYVEELQQGTASGLDGSFVLRNVAEGRYTLRCSYISYQTVKQTVTVKATDKQTKISFKLQNSSTELAQIVVRAETDKSTETSARATERNASMILNVVSAKAIELSPDLNMANVVQRMSGVSIEKTSSSGGQYAILRGMDKRYNYTLVNGIKIPSTHNKHRYISLDLFPSDLVDRVEVSKALTADMEGDAIAGAINVVMKNAPEHFVLNSSASVGYNSFFNNHSLALFNTNSNAVQSPYERNAPDYRATPSDFPSTNLQYQTQATPLNATASLSLGNRFFSKRVGVVFSGSFSNTNKGESGLLFSIKSSNDGRNLPILNNMSQRMYTENERNVGVHNKLDFQFAPQHGIELFSFYMQNQNTQVRETDVTDLQLNYQPQVGTFLQNHSTRFRYNIQNLLSSTLQGKHAWDNGLKLQWSGVYSFAANNTPDQATITYNTDYTKNQAEASFIDFDGSERLWRHNWDKDQAAYLNISYKPIFWENMQLKCGGLYRNKTRESFKTSYTLKAISSSKPSDSIYYSEKGVDWQSYNDIQWKIYNPKGATANGETFDAHETTAAAYALTQYETARFLCNVGVRLEKNTQGYFMQFPIGQPRPDGEQTYLDWLPSLHLKYVLRQKHNFKASYYRAINKPGFLEIVPCPIIEEDYITQGNPDLKRTIADNYDVRWEYFPRLLDQIMLGLFYKRLQDPIEYAFVTIGTGSQKVTYSPINTDLAINKGIEFDVIKFFGVFGLKANYTYTNSSITTNKLSRERDAAGNIVPNFNAVQKRPLYGQAEHVSNLSLLYKGKTNGLNAQLALSYTGERLYTVSQVIDNDLWQKPLWQLDASAEKRFKWGLSVFVKAHNILNVPIEVYIKKQNPNNNNFPQQTATGNTLIRRETRAQSFLLGLRYRIG